MSDKPIDKARHAHAPGRDIMALYEEKTAMMRRDYLRARLRFLERRIMAMAKARGWKPE